MRIFIQVLGTRGDVEILLILAREMVRRGHDVVLGSSPFYESMVVSSEVGWVPLGTGQRHELVSLMQSLSSITDQRQRVQVYAEQWLKPQISQSMATIKGAIASADYVINNLKTVWKRGGGFMPGASVIYDPPESPARAARYAPQRIEHGGALLDLVAMNRALVDPNNEWPSTYHFSGFWFAETDPGWCPDEQLAGFLDHGTPPIVLTMGSMVMLEGVLNGKAS